jgi:hypothetical protein
MHILIVQVFYLTSILLFCMMFRSLHISDWVWCPNSRSQPITWSDWLINRCPINISVNIDMFKIIYSIYIFQLASSFWINECIHPNNWSSVRISLNKHIIACLNQIFNFQLEHGESKNIRNWFWNIEVNSNNNCELSRNLYDSQAHRSIQIFLFYHVKQLIELIYPSELLSAPNVSNSPGLFIIS